MFITNKEVDLGKSFEKLKQELEEIYSLTNPSQPETYAYVVGRLQSAIKVHLAVCTDEKANVPAADPNDLANVNI